MKAFRQIADLSAHARIGSREPRAGQELEKIVKFFALGERVEKNRHRAEIERHRAQAEQMRGDPRRFAADHANGFAARRQFPSPSISPPPARKHVVRQRREIIQPVRVRHELVVLHVLGDFFVAAMQITDVRRRFGDDLAIELQHEPQNSVRRRMRRPHVEHHLLADIVMIRLATAASAATTRVTGSGDSISRVVKGMEEVTRFRVGFTLASGGFFRKRFLGSARLQRAGCGILPTHFFCHERNSLGQHYKSSR